MPKNAKKTVYKEKEFNMYVLWKFLPGHLRGMTKKELTALGFSDPSISKMIKIKTQTEFAKYFNIKDLGTLTDWNNRIKKQHITPPLLVTEYQKQHASLNEKIILPNITELERKIAALKKENTLLKNKTRVRSPRKKETAVQVTASPAPVDKTIFQKIRKLFQ